MSAKRIARLNSLIKEVISEVIAREIKNPKMPQFITVTEVAVTQDLSYAKVWVSVIGSVEDKKRAIAMLEQASGFIAARASKEVTMRYFPQLHFMLDEGLDKLMRVDELLKEVEKERENRPQ